MINLLVVNPAQEGSEQRKIMILFCDSRHGFIVHNTKLYPMQRAKLGYYLTRACSRAQTSKADSHPMNISGQGNLLLSNLRRSGEERS